MSDRADAQMALPGIGGPQEGAAQHSPVWSPPPEPRPPKKRRPESIRDAQTWETNKNRALRLGLCDRCASQYAWGCQIGFTESHPPCDQCAVIVASRPGRERANGWKHMHGAAAHEAGD
jgi:hypothetical protein